jgi:urease accessory protein UreE
MVLTPLASADSAGLADTAGQLQQAVRLGHVLGNQHWPVAVVGEQILVPVALDRAVMETVLRTHHMTDYFQIRYERRAWPQEHTDQKDQHDHKHVTHPSHTH